MTAARSSCLLLIAWSVMIAADMSERKVDPTFLRRYIPDVHAKTTDISAQGCEYKPLFGAGGPGTGILKGVARFGEATAAAGASCKPVSYPTEEQVVVVLEGSGTLRYGGENAPVKKNDFMYLPAGVQHGISNSGTSPLRFLVMGFRVPADTPPPSRLQIANIDEVKTQTVGGHPDSVVYQLLMGDTKSQRDRLACARLVTSLFVMTFQPGGTNFPHHHDNEEEIYVLLSGTGDMVAGSGTDGVEGRFPARPGDAYAFRLNATVGFYNGNSGPARILAVRSIYPRKRD